MRLLFILKYSDYINDYFILLCFIYAFLLTPPHSSILAQPYRNYPAGISIKKTAIIDLLFFLPVKINLETKCIMLLSLSVQDAIAFFQLNLGILGFSDFKLNKKRML